MATKIRLQRHGKKRYAYYHIVIADGRAKRDGKYIERIGNYNPNTDPATIELDFDRALYWLQTGAQPTDTARAILSYKGVMYKNHLVNGAKKGALTDEAVEQKFNSWLEEKNQRIQAKRDRLAQKAAKEHDEKMKTETAKSEKRAAEILAKQTPPPAEGEAAAAPSEAVAEGTESADGAGDLIADASVPAETAEADTSTEPVAEEKPEETPAEASDDQVSESSVEEPNTVEEEEATASEAKTEEAPEAEAKTEEPDVSPEDTPAEEAAETPAEEEKPEDTSAESNKEEE